MDGRWRAAAPSKDIVAETTARRRNAIEGKTRLNAYGVSECGTSPVLAPGASRCVACV